MTDFIPWAEPTLWGNEERYVLEALHSTWISGGPFVERLEKDFAKYCGTADAIAVSNGTAALHAVYLAASIGHGDEVIVPGFAFMAAANMALMVGAKPVFADVDPLTWCMTAESVNEKLSSKTRAVVAVDTYGNVCEMDEIRNILRARNVLLVEDAAEAIGSRLDGRMAGSMGDVGVFSFHATKTITTGEGGSVVTNDPVLSARLRLFRSHGMGKVRYFHDVAGHNFRMTNLQAAFGCAQLESIDSIVGKRAEVYASYVDELQSVPGLTMQVMTPGVSPVVWAVAVLLDRKKYPKGRDWVIEKMMEAGVETRPGFYSAASMPDLYDSSGLPVSDELASNLLVLPSSPTMDSEKVASVCRLLVSLGK